MNRLDLLWKPAVAGAVAASLLAGGIAHAATARSAGARAVEPSALPTRAFSKKCSVAKAGGQSYNVSAIAVSCAFADKWVVALAGKRLQTNGKSVTISGGPAKYICRGGSKGPNDNFPKLKANIQIAGNCAKGAAGLGGFGGAPYFNWVVISPR